MEDALDSKEEVVSLEKGELETPTLTLGEMGRSGLIVLGGDIFEECQHELRWPEAMNTFKEMSKDPSIAAALDYVDNKVCAAKWEVKLPIGAPEELKAKAQFLQQCMTDMDHTWTDFIRQASSFGRYGFAVVEKVYRYREYEKGSRYNDRLIAPKKLVLRSPDSIDRWRWTANGKDLAGLYQNILIPASSGLPHEGWYPTLGGYKSIEQKFIPRKKFLHFRHNPQKDSPIGTSPLSNVWQAWKMKKAYQESEALGTAQDANAFKVLYIPAEYLLSDASDDKKAALAIFQKALTNAHQARESGMILPTLYDDKGNKMFDFEIKSITGIARYDTDEIITRYNKEILVGLFADVLALGQDGGGSYSLSESKLTVIDLAVKVRLDTIQDQLNHDLVRQIFELNGWSTDILPYFSYNLPEEINLDDLSKFIQRTKAVGFLPRTLEVVNWMLKQAGIPQLPESTTQEELDELLGESTSRSGDGMEAGMGNGTGQAVSSDDNAVRNTEN